MNPMTKQLQIAKEMQQQLVNFEFTNSQFAEILSINESTYRKLKANDDLINATWYLTNCLIDLHATIDRLQKEGKELTISNITKAYIPNYADIEKAMSVLQNPPSFAEISKLTKIPKATLYQLTSSSEKMQKTKWHRVYKLARLDELFSDINRYKSSRIAEYLRLNSN